MNSPMNRMSSTIHTRRWGTLRWMVWKENRLVAPLFVSLVVAFVLVAILQTTMDVGSVDSIPMIQSAQAYTPLLFPVLLAAGLGLILVGQEREQGTLAWLRSLPLSPKNLLGIKFAVAVFWMVLAWALAILFGADKAISMSFIVPASQRGLIPMSYPFWIVQSVFVLLAGFYASCRWQSSQASVFGLIFIASIPAIVSGCLGILISATSTILQITVWITIALIPVLAAMAYRSAMLLLSPAVVGGKSERRSPSGLTQARSLGHFGSASSALNWHTLRSSQSLMLAIVAVIVYGTVTPFLIDYLAIKQSAFIMMLMLPCLLLPFAICWAGVSVFQSDGSAERLRFLADRGVSPLRIFWSRYLPIASILCLLAVVFTLAATWLVIVDDSERQWTRMFPSPLSIIVIGGILFTVGSWISQLVRGPVISYLVSPIAAFTVLGWLAFCYGQMTTPLWLAIVVGITIPIVVTVVMMRLFVEGRDRPFSFLVGGIATALIFVLPLIPAIARVQSINTIPGDQRHQLLAEANAAMEQARNPARIKIAKFNPMPSAFTELQQRRPDSGAMFWKSDDAELIQQFAAWPKTFAKDPIKLVGGLDQLIANPNLPAMIHDSGQFQHIFSEMELVKLAAITDANDANVDELESWVEAASIIVAGLRRSIRFKDQETADVVEIWLTDTLSHDSLNQSFDPDVVQKSLARLPTPPERAASRRRAVLAGWGKYLKGSRKIRSFDLDHGIQYQTAGLTPWTKDRRAESIVMTLLDAAENPTADSWWMTMHSLMSYPKTEFAGSPYGPNFRGLPAMKSLTPDFRFPARYWGMDWEGELLQLQEQGL